MSLSAAIFDDEPLARARLHRLLKELSIDVIGQGENGEQAIEVAVKHEPDLLFLDIQMPRVDGLSAAKSINELLSHPPAIIFCTAYDEYAVEAFKTNATAYLLKPFDIEDLKGAIERSHTLNRVQILELKNQNTAPDYLPISSNSGIEKIDIHDIVLFLAFEKNVYATLNSGRKILISTPLKEIENRYSSVFIRISRSTILNKNQIRSLSSDDNGYTVTLDYNNKKIAVSRRKLSSVRAAILDSGKNS